MLVLCATLLAIASITMLISFLGLMVCPEDEKMITQELTRQTPRRVLPARTRVELIETRDRLAAERHRVETAFTQASTELDELERDQALEQGHQTYRLSPRGN